MQYFCDSIEAWNKYITKFPEHAHLPLGTKSPAVHFNKSINSVLIDQCFDSKTRICFNDSLEKNILEIKERYEESSFNSLYLSLFLQLYVEIQNCIIDGIFLEKTDFSQPIIVVNAVTGAKEVDEAIASSVPKSISGYQHLETVSISIPTNDERSARGASATSTLQKLKNAGFVGLFNKVAGTIDSSVFQTGGCRIGVLGDNELQRFVLSNLLLQRVCYKRFDMPDLKAIKIPVEIPHQDILRENWRFVERQLNFVKNKTARELVEKSIRNIFCKQFLEAKRFSALFKHFFNEHSRLTHVLVPFFKGAKAIGLRDAALRSGVKIFSCQHGVTRELVEKLNFRFMLYETAFSDGYFTYNPRAKFVTRKFGLNGNRVSVISLKFPHHLQGKYVQKSKVRKNPKILYVSTLLNIGNRPNGIQFKSDLDKFNFESLIIDKVLKQSSRKIYYKPYIAYRFIDKDPLMLLASKCDNISIVGTHIDLRYIARDFDIFITSQATSTFAWLAIENKPLIFIDDDKTSRLDKTVLPDFKKSFFYFDGARKNFYSEIQSFLSLDLKTIYGQWDEKYANRVAFLEYYCFGSAESKGKNIKESFQLD
ncbi:hypothetical protein OAP53_00105 [Alphaproteobacteria bacterium]|nr:hypothetical protein [Alphaproteobacteria bacterium]